MFQRRLGGVIAIVALVAAACGRAHRRCRAPAPRRAAIAGRPGTEPPASAPTVDVIDTIGEGEGELNLIIWPGYAENGVERQGVRLGPSRSRTQTGCIVKSRLERAPRTRWSR